MGKHTTNREDRMTARRSIPTAAEHAAQLAAAAEQAQDRVMNIHTVGEDAMQSARSYLADGNWRHAKVCASIATFERQLARHNADRLAAEAAEAAAKAERVAALRADPNRPRMALPELRAGLRTVGR